MIKKYANAGTDAYMSNREVHFLASIDSSMLNQLGRIFNLAKDNRLRSAKIRSTSGSQTYLEFVSYDGNRAPAFIAEVERYGSCSIVSPEDIRVH